MEKQRLARVTAAKGSLDCSCGGVVGGEHAKHCTQNPLRRLTIAKLPQHQVHHPQIPVLSQPPNQHPQPLSYSHAPHHHPQMQEAAIAVTSSRQPFVTQASSSEGDMNQVR